MDVNARVKMQIGELVISLQAAQAKIEELEAKIAELEKAAPAPAST